MGPFSARYSAVPVLVSALAATLTAAPTNPFGALALEFEIDARELTRMDRGGTLVRVNTSSIGDLAVFAAVRVNASPAQVLGWLSRVEMVQKGRYVTEIGRFSAPPEAGDLETLTVEDGDLDELADCEEGDCGLKLNATEIRFLAAGQERTELANRFRQLLVRRAADYLTRGDCMRPYVDHETPVFPGAMFQALLDDLEFMPRVLPVYADYLRRYPEGPTAHVRESFLYWSKEKLGMKPITSITHFSAATFQAADLPEVVAVAKQVYASHYKNASLSLTALVRGENARYLVYVNRTHVDAFTGMFGGMVRRIVNRRVKSEAPAILQQLRRRIESGDPPA